MEVLEHQITIFKKRRNWTDIKFYFYINIYSMQCTAIFICFTKCSLANMKICIYYQLKPIVALSIARHILISRSLFISGLLPVVVLKTGLNLLFTC